MQIWQFLECHTTIESMAFARLTDYSMKYPKDRVVTQSIEKERLRIEPCKPASRPKPRAWPFSIDRTVTMFLTPLSESC